MAGRNINRVEHEGVVKEVGENVIKVEIVSKSACSACHAKSMCSMSDQKEKIIEIPYSIESLVQDIKQGDKVNVVLQSSLGLKAVFISYVIPLIILMILIVTLPKVGLDELMTGVCSLAGVAVYYLFVLMFRNKLERIFTFSIEKL
ncbi:MAG: SoxR reducing system RseC family protein [Bacteroidales bacterium]|nr:SoxR reducing system RseC family protein [Bacteroidales bacterium]